MITSLVWSIIALLAAFMLFLGVYIIGKTVPYEPLVVENFEFTTSTSCPGDLVILNTERDLDESKHIKTAHIESYWFLEGDTRPYLPYSFDLSPEELAANEGVLLRFAPLSYGKWYVHTEVVIEGTVLGFVPRTSEIYLQTEQPLEIEKDQQDCSIDSNDAVERLGV